MLGVLFINVRLNEFVTDFCFLFFDLVFAGAQYFDNTSLKEKEDDVVQPNSKHVYYWEVTADVSPQKNDPTCLTYTYISHANFVEDFNSGLIGALLICKPGKK